MMKRLLAFILLIVSLTACTGASPFGKHNCSHGGEVCVEVRAEEPISYDGAVTVSITVISEKEISDLGISLSHNADVVVEVPESWEKDSRNVTFFKGGTSWLTTVSSKESIIFSRTLDLPPREGSFYIIVGARKSGLEAVDQLKIIMTQDGGKVYLSGTPIPITPELLPVYTVTPGPSPTYVPTVPFPPTPTTYTTETATSPPYPGPEADSPPTSPPIKDQGTPAYPPP